MRGAVKSAQSSYLRDEEGSFAIFSLFGLLIILILAGIGVDIMRHESLRTRLQGTLDSAVLAAANLETGGDSKAVVLDYFAKAGLGEYISGDDVIVGGEGTNGRDITATVKGTVPTYFLKFVGIDDLELGTHAKAQQGITDIEIALVLDVSNSMNNYSRLTNLQSAGEDFADIVFGNSDPDHIAVSVIPYSTQVNPSPAALDALDLDDAHTASSCLNFEENDFLTPTLLLSGNSVNRKYQQTLHFDPWYNYVDYYGNPVYYPGLIRTTCNPATNNQVLFYSKSKESVINKIKGLTASGNTSTDIGALWGAAALDPKNRGLSTSLAAGNKIAQDMQHYPLDKRGSSLKVMVLMTDGWNSDQFFIKDAYRSGMSDLYTYNNRVSFPARKRSCSYSYWYGYQCTWYDGYLTPENGNFYNGAPYGGNAARQMPWSEVWSTMTVNSHAIGRNKAKGDSTSWWKDEVMDKHQNGVKNTRLSQVCEASKEQGVIIFTIGFEVGRENNLAAEKDATLNLLKNCASSINHYNNAAGAELSDVFSSIATKVTELRLTQ